MTPELCRNARKALSMKYEEVAAAIGVRPVMVMGFELGKPTEEETIAKLRAFFEEHDIVVINTGPNAGAVVRYRRYTTKWEDDE